MKKIFSIAILFLSLQTTGQQGTLTARKAYISQQLGIGVASPISSAGLQLGDSATTKAMILPRVQTTGGVLSPHRQGMFVYNISDAHPYWRDLTAWRKVASHTDISNITGCYRLIDGGIVTWSGTGLIMDVSPAHYVINCNFYNSPAAQVTLSAAHATLPRLDVIAADTNSSIVVITGTPATNPVKPQVNTASQIELTTILIPAASTTPGGITQTIIYDENTEWTSASGLTAGTVDFNSTSNPFHSSKNALLSSTAAGTISWTNATSLTLSSYSSLKLYVRLDAAASAFSPAVYIGINSTLSGSVPLSNYGFSTSVSGSYQVITIPVTDFMYSYPADAFNSLVIKFPAAGTTVHIDYVQLQGGISGGSSPYITDVYRKAGTDSVFKVINNISLFAFKDSTGGAAGWGFTGNSITAGNNFLGTTNNTSLRLYTNNTQKANLDSTGCLAIGMAPSPSILGSNDAKLNVQGTVAFFQSGVLKTYWGLSAGNSMLVMRNGSALDKIKLNTGGDSYLSGGNVGINTSTPSALLSVGSASDFQINSSGKIAKYANSSITNGQLLIGHTANGTFEKAVLTQGSGITITNGAGSVTIAADAQYTEGTYTPTLTNTTNIAASTAYTTYYIRIGDMVHVWGEVDIDATAGATITEMGMSLPTVSGVGQTYHVAGTASFEDNTAVQIKGDVANNRAKWRFTPQSATNNKYSFHFTYKHFTP